MLKENKMKKAKKIILVFLIMFALFFVYTEIMIYSYLKDYGYGFRKINARYEVRRYC